MVLLRHELGWVIDFEETLDALWAGEVKFIENETDGPMGYRKVIGYVQDGEEVIFNVD
jgi:hypothetical protein